MKLKSLKDSPPGIGWVFPVLQNQPWEKAESYRSLVRKVKNVMVNNNVPVPLDLEAQIQDWICSNSNSPCWYSDGLGDKIAGTIHAVTKVVDRVFKTNITGAAKGCKSCGGRRKAMNQ